jgi:hypothetical protein
MAKRRFSLCAFLFKISFFLAMGAILYPAAGYGGEKGWEEPWGPFQSSPAVKQEAKESLSWPQRAAVGAIGFFRDTISTVDGDRCPSFPSCSQYGQQAIRKHGIFIGWVMTFDRLLHEADEVYLVPQVQVNGAFRAYDPVENNDFWWVKK